MKNKLITAISVILLLNAMHAHADTPSGNDTVDTIHNAATGFLSGVTSIVSDTAADSIKNYANQPDSTVTSVSADVGKVSTALVGIDIVVARASIMASKAVTKSAGEVSEAISSMAIKQNETNKVVMEAMETQKLRDVAMEKATNNLNKAAKAMQETYKK